MAHLKNPINSSLHIPPPSTCSRTSRMNEWHYYQLILLFSSLASKNASKTQQKTHSRLSKLSATNRVSIHFSTDEVLQIRFFSFRTSPIRESAYPLFGRQIALLFRSPDSLEANEAKMSAGRRQNDNQRKTDS